MFLGVAKIRAPNFYLFFSSLKTRTTQDFQPFFWPSQSCLKLEARVNSFICLTPPFLHLFAWVNI